LSEEVYRVLEQRIRKGKFEPESQLPTEKQLAESFGVSRAVIREAVSRLKADGLIMTVQGLGAFVSLNPGMSSFKLDRGDGPSRDDMKHLFELRAVIEVAVAELAASRRTANDLNAMEVRLEKMERAIREGLDGTDDDDAFHLAIAEATHNPYVKRFVAFVGHQFADTRRPSWGEEGRREGRAAEAQSEHRKLYAAIKTGNVRSAGRAALAHLLATAKRSGVEAAFELLSSNDYAAMMGTSLKRNR
jgi:GntR family transcriptional regulator, transcriptional repressor for pyruvate dehydrogenase complex